MRWFVVEETPDAILVPIDQHSSSRRAWYHCPLGLEFNVWSESELEQAEASGEYTVYWSGWSG